MRVPGAMPVTGQAKTGLEERRFNAGLQQLPSGRSVFPVARNSEFHRTINQRLPELWADFSDRALPEGRSGTHSKLLAFHGDSDPDLDVRDGDFTGRPARQAPGALRATATLAVGQALRPGRVVFVGFAEFDMDGRLHTAGEMDRLMQHSASSKYPCSRPATFDEYADEGGPAIVGLPQKNTSGRDIVFVGPGGTGCELFHTNTLGSQKCAVPPGEALDGTWGIASMYGRKTILCVYPIERVKRQQSLTQFGLCRNTVGPGGRMRRAGSLASLQDKTSWTSGDFRGSTHQAQRAVRMDQFFK